MKCRSCGYVSLDRSEVCGNCGAPASPATSVPARPAPAKNAGAVEARPWLDAGSAAILMSEPVAAPARVRDETKRRRGERRPAPQPGESLLPQGSGGLGGDSDAALTVGDEDLDVQEAPRDRGSRPEAAAFSGVPLREEDLQPALLAPCPASPVGFSPPPPLPLDLGEPGAPPVIDRVEEIPGHFWAPEGAGLIRRSAANLVDQALLAALLGLFLAGASLALSRAGLAASALFSSAGLRAALPPLAVLAALLSFAYHVSFAAVAGRTPGKRLAGLEIRRPDGSAPTWATAVLRWVGGTLGLVCGGVGIAWALFEPRRRGWADLLSSTVVAARSPEDVGRAR